MPHANRLANLGEFELPVGWDSFPDPEGLREDLESVAGVAVENIGASREGRPMAGYRFGRGETRVSVIAGCHADEPVGPMTARLLPRMIQRYAPELTERFTFRVVPQMNPDGAERNRPWFAEPFDLAAYIEHAQRELPGDDIEFGFGEDDGARPENRAAMDWLRPGAPYAAHFSLHGMAFAEGAWWLIHRAWKERSEGLRREITAACAAESLPLHDVERRGEKGFERIAEGFCTTPNSVAMKEHFLALGDDETAAKFRPSSMEWVRSLGGDPFCMVTELPLFLVGKRSPSLSEPVAPELKRALTDAMAESRDDKRREAVARVEAEYRIRPLPLAQQVRLQFAAIAFTTGPNRTST